MKPVSFMLTLMSIRSRRLGSGGKINTIAINKYMDLQEKDNDTLNSQRPAVPTGDTQRARAPEAGKERS